MDNLLSGLFGAIIATLLTVLYLYFTEKIRRRYEVYLEVVTYLDEIYIRLQAIFSYTNKQYDGFAELYFDATGLTQEDIYKANLKVIELILSHGIRRKVAAEYGKGQILIDLVELLDLLKRIYNELFTASKAAWIVNEFMEINDLFRKEVDPLRTRLQDQLMRELSAINIIKQLLDSLKKPILHRNK